uniref:Endonuclease/exonuclease/phosphatase domain-containing protein n=1 Tax=Phlebotomus papatasi TaxID=29031 RepID=A0A1B0GPH6_PHLPP
ELVIGGDFNAHSELWGSLVTNSRGNSLQNWIEASNLVVLNDGRPTRLACPPVSSSAIDVTLVSARGAMSWKWAVCEDPLGSDHIPIIAKYEVVTHLEDNETYVASNQHIRDARTDWKKFRQSVKHGIIGIAESCETNAQKLDNLVQVLWNSAVSAQRSGNSRRGSMNMAGNTARDKVWFDSEIYGDSKIMAGYADDIAIGVIHSNPDMIEQLLSTACSAIQGFLESKGLSLSIQKSVFQLFTRKHNPPNIRVEWDGTKVQSVTSFRYLGVVFFSKCLWAAQIRSIVSACSKRINFMRAVSGQTWGAHPAILRIMYIMTIRSVLEYGCIVFRTAARTHLIKLYRIQWQCLRICLGLMKSTHTMTVEVLAGVCPLQLRFGLLAERFLIKASTRQPDLWTDIAQLQQAGPR